MSSTKSYVFSSIRQDVLDNGYMDQPDAVYITFHTMVLGKKPEALNSVMFPSLHSHHVGHGF